MKNKIICFLNKTKILIKNNKGKSVFLAVSLFLFILFPLLKKSQWLCEYVFARNISRYLLWGISSITNIIPFSITEWAVIFAVIIVIYFIIKAIRSFIRGDRKYSYKILYNFIAIFCVLLLSLNILFSFSYNRNPALPYLNLEFIEPSTEIGKDATLFYIEKASTLSEKFERDENGGVISPYTFDQLVDIINDEYKRLDEEYFSPFTVHNKQMIFSKAMSYMNLTGIYFPYFAESNINVHTTDYTIASTIIHEMAHSKGVMRENEANFIASYLLITSENEYLNYIGYMQASSWMLAEMYDPNNVELYMELYSQITPTMFLEYSNSNRYWEQFDTIFDKIASFFNDRYLKSQGVVSGTKSYSQVGEFLMSLYQSLQ